MAKKKPKAAAKKKPAVRRAPARRAAPAAAPAQTAALQFPLQVHVLKGGDKIPVMVADQSHLDRLRGEHGNSGVEVPK